MKVTATLFTLFFFTIIWVGQPNKMESQENSKPLILGNIYEIESKVLNEKRILNIYLPEGYNPNDSIK